MYHNTLIFALLIFDLEKCSIVFHVLGVTGYSSYARIVLSRLPAGARQALGLCCVARPQYGLTIGQNVTTHLPILSIAYGPFFPSCRGILVVRTKNSTNTARLPRFTALFTTPESSSLLLLEIHT
jgi:hypothetical protein